MVIVYEGPHAAVDVPAAGLVGVERGKPVEVKDDVATSLLEQATWAKATKKAVSD